MKSDLFFKLSGPFSAAALVLAKHYLVDSETAAINNPPHKCTSPEPAQHLQTCVAAKSAPPKYMHTVHYVPPITEPCNLPSYMQEQIHTATAFHSHIGNHVNNHTAEHVKVTSCLPPSSCPAADVECSGHSEVC